MLKLVREEKVMLCAPVIWWFSSTTEGTYTGPRLCRVAYTLVIHACTGLMTEHYIIAVKNDQVLYDCHHGHPVLVVPVGYFQKQKGKALDQIN